MPSGSKFFYLCSRLGSVRQVIDTSGFVKHLYTYGPFGKKLESDSDDDDLPNPFRFTGQYFDADTGDYHLRARQYSPTLQRFTSRDPYLGQLEEPATLHAYLYCLNNPINATDPTGEFSLIDISATSALGMSIEGSKPYGDILRISRGLCDMFSFRNMMLGDLVGASYGPVDTAALDIAIGAYQVYNAGQVALLGSGLLKAGAQFATRGAGAVFRFAKRGGHHIIPRWAGGSTKQLLYRLADQEHLGKLEPRIRKMMKNKYGINIVGRGNTRSAIKGMIKRDGLQGDIFDDLLDIYREYDMMNGTNLTSGFWGNVMYGLYESL